jgi:hypothetical protein
MQTIKTRILRGENESNRLNEKRKGCPLVGKAANEEESCSGMLFLK